MTVATQEEFAYSENINLGFKKIYRTQFCMQNLKYSQNSNQSPAAADKIAVRFRVVIFSLVVIAQSGNDNTLTKY